MRSILLISLFVVLALGDYCLEFPKRLGKGASCPGDSNFCDSGYFCDHTHTCAPLIEDGKTCFENFGGCQSGSRCKGPDDNKICVKNAGPGESCNSDNDVTIPNCGGSLTCTNNKCTGGRYGDRCGANSDCISQVCNNLVCSLPNPVFNTTCTSQNSVDFCGLDHYCLGQLEGFSFTYRCAPRVASGAECATDNQCPINHECAKKENKQDALSYCVPHSSLDPGAFCQSKSELCKSGLQSAAYCSDKFPEYCAGSCGSLGQGVCYCGSRPRLSGSGKCKENPCLKFSQPLLNCMKEKCLITDFSFPDYSTSCLTINCLAPFDDAINCAQKNDLFFYDN